MKKLSTVSLFIFGVVVTAILVAGLVFYQNKKNNQVADSNTGVLVQDTINQLTASGKSLVLDMTEISKHNKRTDCWMLIDGKVYNITSYFGSHPGGNNTMAATCGKDATFAYSTKDPYAKNNTKGQSHSADAKGLLSDYYIGDLNQTIGKQKTSTNINPITNSKSNSAVNLDINNPIPKTIPPTSVLINGNITLSIAEIAKHNKSSDCWYLINGKVYNITSFFGSHPGGNSTMTPSCGKDATSAYMTKDPYASTSGSRPAHSSNALSMLNSYYIGDLNQTIGQQKIVDTNTVVAPVSNGDDEGEYEDD